MERWTITLFVSVITWFIFQWIWAVYNKTAYTTYYDRFDKSKQIPQIIIRSLVLITVIVIVISVLVLGISLIKHLM